ncbi:glycine--tRNA ligase [Sharpea azabuensis]|uniref:Glycine--tRNA ligase n=1 Tax=Sharpea azabuensis TaxID=322505 RepID=A0A1H6SVQ8_9FIRM|nr:glycine--tRNA ligase [Sharpea azabuensis]HAJ16059.1 glycine--tRNA ligase [Erysipelotrichaceae bacterium]MDD6512760.1 glycine--tRNA ligase [Sharpea azabuensis]MEE3308310.1 glycine--tRNA ligase [Sharpea azabuensis]SEI68130.1 glycyl-tRNA synthetase [Sharpea azabuensis]SFE04182.1 glycyl-tRNA synthetase [Sharpea azabuensis]
MALDMEKLIAHAKNNGFVYQGSEIYDGLANTWDYGPLGVELKNNIKRAWWKRFIQESPYNVGIDSAIFMNPRVWEASGHIGNFNDPLIDCKKCGKRHRADKLIEAYDPNMHADGMEPEEMMAYIREHNIGCPDCGGHDFTDIRKFELMFETSMGVVKDAKSTVYLRPETAQGIFVNFKNVARTTRKKVPFGIGQIGKSFRNEITPGNFIFRTREFEQMELEFFTKPDTDLEWFSYWRSACMNFLKDLGLKEENLRFRDHEQKELSFYSKATTDIEYLYPFGWGELWGIADRTDYDLNRHMEYSKKDLTYLDPTTHEKYVPYVIEPSVGADRLFLSVIADAYDEEELEGGDTRIVMHLHPALAPIKVAVLPLTKKLSEKAEAIYASLSADFNTEYDVSGKIGKRYRRQDEIGTPLCVTVDFDTLEDEAVTVRDRDTMKQERVKIEDLKDYIAKRVAFK